MLGMGLLFPMKDQSGGGQLQPEVSTYLSLVGPGNISSSVIAAINAFVVTGKQNGWWDQLVEVYPFCGNTLTASLVKLKSQTATTSLTNTNFVSGDYSQASGFGNAASNSNKFLSTSFIPSDSSFTNTNFSQSIFIISLQATTTSTAGFVVGDLASSSVVFGSITSIGIIGPAQGSLSVSPSGVGARVYSTNSTNFFNLQTTVPQDQSNTTLGSATLNNEVALFKRTSGGNPFYVPAKIGITTFGRALTLAQGKSLGLAMWNFERTVRTIVAWAGTKAAWLGDSLTYGSLATATASQFSNLVSANKSWLEFNFGVPNSRTTTDQPAGGNWALALLNRYTAIYDIPTFDKIMVMIGTNDQSQDITLNGDAALISTYQTNLTTILTGLKNQYGAANVFAISPPWNTANLSIKNDAWNTGMSNAATAAGLPSNNFINGYQNFVDAGSPATWISGGIHLTDLGHSSYATYIETFV